MTAINLLDSDTKNIKNEKEKPEKEDDKDNIERKIVDSPEEKKSEEKPLLEKNKEPLAKPKRLISLDAFRGLTIIGMLLVNNIALDYKTPAHLTHAAWNQGVTFADMVFPWFLLIVGVAIPYASE